mmetsp:Transcript_39111/g.90601  ORF Transcript_39111/g.90601 Transcript_39111/m.90601 type:complete len:299 (-) Transcript_39111:31-927(-)
MSSPQTSRASGWRTARPSSRRWSRRRPTSAPSPDPCRSCSTSSTHSSAQCTYPRSRGRESPPSSKHYRAVKMSTTRRTQSTSRPGERSGTRKSCGWQWKVPSASRAIAKGSGTSSPRGQRPLPPPPPPPRQLRCGRRVEWGRHSPRTARARLTATRVRSERRRMGTDPCTRTPGTRRMARRAKTRGASSRAFASTSSSLPLPPLTSRNNEDRLSAGLAAAPRRRANLVRLARRPDGRKRCRWRRRHIVLVTGASIIVEKALSRGRCAPAGGPLAERRRKILGPFCAYLSLKKSPKKPF